MHGIFGPVLRPLLRRDPREVEKRAIAFRIESEEGRALVNDVGRAFLQGYNAMLDATAPHDVAVMGKRVEAHFRPFFFEGAAMGYLPRSWIAGDARPDRAESDLLALDGRYLYLYYVGIGVWYGFRHRRRPAALERLAEHFNPMYFPLCYDGFGFKVGFFDFPAKHAARDTLMRAPAHRRANAYQGFGRALHFVFMDDAAGFERERSRVPAEHAEDVEAGRSLALSFAGLRAPERLLAHLASSPDDRRGSRLLGASWALTAREMNDPDHFGACLSALPPEDRELLRALPALCRDALARSKSYDEWRRNTKAAAEEAWNCASRSRGR